MPAVTVSDTSVLPRIAQPELTAVARPVIQRTDAPSGEGEGFPVRRAFASVDLRRLDPFIHMDQMGEVEYAPGEPKGTPWHPHRGFETVTYIMDGVFDHQDSNGGGGTITDGDTQWMTAGSGLLHIEAPPMAGHPGWALPRYPAVGQPPAPPEAGHAALPGPARLLRRPGDDPGRRGAGARHRRDVAGLHGPGSTHTPMALVHATLSPTAHLDLPWPTDFNALVYVLSGEGSVAETPVRTGNLAVLGAGDLVMVSANRSQQSRLAGLDVLVLGGRPIREPVAWAGRSS